MTSRGRNPTISERIVIHMGVCPLSEPTTDPKSCMTAASTSLPPLPLLPHRPSL